MAEASLEIPLFGADITYSRSLFESKKVAPDFSPGSSAGRDDFLVEELK